MNLEREQQQLPVLPLQQQHHQQHQYYQQQHPQNTSMALISSGEYVNFKPINTTTATTNLIQTAQDPIPLNNTAHYTEMTIPIDLPTPPLSETLLTPTTVVPTTTTTPTTTTFETMGVMTSSFKTSLLPMPTLEDIEDGVIYDQHQQQQGILKYCTSPPTTQYRNTSELNLPLGLVTDCTSSTVVSHDVATLTTSAPTATIGATRNKYSALKITADINNRSISSSCMSEIPISDVYAEIVKSTMPVVSTTQTNATTMPSSTTTTITAQGLRLKSSGASSTAASNAKLSQQKPHSSTRSCCYPCFAQKNPNDTQHSTTDAKTKRRKRKTQTLWSAFITNVGICALLLAYTFLGKYIL